jgi:hypothetical protein
MLRLLTRHRRLVFLTASLLILTTLNFSSTSSVHAQIPLIPFTCTNFSQLTWSGTNTSSDGHYRVSVALYADLTSGCHAFKAHGFASSDSGSASKNFCVGQVPESSHHEERCTTLFGGGNIQLDSDIWQEDFINCHNNAGYADIQGKVGTTTDFFC